MEGILHSLQDHGNVYYILIDYPTCDIRTCFKKVAEPPAYADYNDGMRVKLSELERSLG
jgi:hypothetical protein